MRPALLLSLAALVAVPAALVAVPAARAAAPPLAAGPSAPLPPASAPPVPAAAPHAEPALAAPAAPALGPSPVPPTSAAPSVSAEAAPSAPPAEPASTAPHVVPTADATRKDSDHAAVVGAWGVEVRPVATTMPVFTRRPTTGCPAVPADQGTNCAPVAISMLGVRHWVGPSLALNGGLALALGGGRDAGRLLDSYFGVGPSLGASLLLGNWRHLAVAASPSLMFVVWKAASSADSTYVADLRADLEGELHFGFIGVPALSLSLRSGVLLRLERAGETTLWSAGVVGSTTLRSLVSDLALRYYF